MTLKFKTRSFLFCAILTVSTSLQSYAGNQGSSSTSLSGLSDREIVRRQEDVDLVKNLLQKGDQAFASGDYEGAYTYYLDAVEKIPSSPEFAAQRKPALEKFSRGSIAYANWLIQNGRYSDAEKVAKTILLPQFNPTYRPAIQLLANLEQPGHYNKTVSPEFAAQKEKVVQLLNEAEGYYQAGRYDLASKRYEQVLNIDDYNIAARQGMERVNLERTQYYSEARNETRSRMLWNVTKEWERPVRKFQKKGEVLQDVSKDIKGTELIQSKLNRIIIPKIDLRDATVAEALDFLKQQSERLDNSPDSQRRGVNIILKLDSLAPSSASAPTDPTAPAPAAPAQIAAKTITLQLANVPLYEALRYVSELAGLKIKVEPYAVSLVPVTDLSGDFITKEYRVPAGFIPPQTVDPAAGAAAPSFGASPTSGTARLPGRADAKTYLESQSIPFPPGASATYIPAGSKLVVRNTLDNIDLIDAYISAQVGGTPTQVEIESRFVEINQNDLKELGFDWLLGPLAIGGGVYGAGGSGGTVGNQYPFQSGGSAIGSTSSTTGLRTGSGSSPNSAVTVNSVDSLLAAATGASLTSAAAPALFGLSGIFTNPQFQVVIRGLDQKKGVDLMTAPKVTTKSGLKATVKIAREFIYPTEFDPPQIPQDTTSATGGGGGAGGGGFGAVFQTPGAVTPSNPTGWTTRNLGVTLGVTPTIGPDNYTIDLEVEPEVVDFDGFINYGSPINAVGYRAEIPGSDVFAIGTVFIPEIQVLTENVINQPIFTTRKVTTSVTIWDGQTVALGGLIREDVQKVQDKVPFLGDIPFAGRLFRSNVDQKIKKNLVVFVTAKLIDAQGQLVRLNEDEEEIVDTVGLPTDLPRPQFPMKGGK